MEVPTGALADMFGKRPVFIISVFLSFVGNTIMGSAQNLNHLLLAVFVGAVGGTLYSGTFEALIYDSLKDLKRESGFAKIWSNMHTFQLLAIGISGVVGGYLYSINPRFPFLALAGLELIGFFLSLFIVEPKFDSVKFSLKNYLKQNLTGVKTLFHNSKEIIYTIIMIAIPCILVISDEMLNDVLIVEQGISSKQLAILSTVTFILAAIVVQISPKLVKWYKEDSRLIIASTIIGITFIISPVAGLVVGSAAYLIRYVTESLYYNFISISLNKRIQSRDRATVLSTFNMMKNLPYVFTAYTLGYLMDFYSGKTFAFSLGIVIFIFIIVHMTYTKHLSE